MPHSLKTCRYRGCTCRVDEAHDYCSPSCETAAAGGMEDGCNCGHPACAASVGNAAAEGRPANTFQQS